MNSHFGEKIEIGGNSRMFFAFPGRNFCFFVYFLKISSMGMIFTPKKTFIECDSLCSGIP